MLLAEFSGAVGITFACFHLHNSGYRCTRGRGFKGETHREIRGIRETICPVASRERCRAKEPFQSSIGPFTRPTRSLSLGPRATNAPAERPGSRPNAVCEQSCTHLHPQLDSDARQRRLILTPAPQYIRVVLSRQLPIAPLALRGTATTRDHRTGATAAAPRDHATRDRRAARPRRANAATRDRRDARPPHPHPPEWATATTRDRDRRDVDRSKPSP
jgi:hypothetical protein